MKKNYIRMWDYRIRNTLGNIHVVDFKTSHVRTFFSTLSDEGLAHSTIKGLYGLLNPSFELAVCEWGAGCPVEIRLAPTVAERRTFRCTDYNECLQSYCR